MKYKSDLGIMKMIEKMHEIQKFVQHVLLNFGIKIDLLQVLLILQDVYCIWWRNWTLPYQIWIEKIS